MILSFRSGDSTARLWHLGIDSVGQKAESIVLSHQPPGGGQQGHVTSEGSNRDVTSVHWSVSIADYSFVNYYIKKMR